MVMRILKEMGLQPSPHDPFLYSGILTADETKILSTTYQKIHIGLYVDDFIFFSVNTVEEDFFEKNYPRNSK